jgi:hypothetical protein
MAHEGHHTFLVQNYHMNQHELAFQDLEISYESGFCKILADYVGIK